MPPASDGYRTVGCSFSKLVPDESHRIRDAVARTHEATVLATELLNMHLRRCLQGDADTDLRLLFNKTWVLNAFNEVTSGNTIGIVPELRQTRECCMPSFVPPSRIGIQQCNLYNADNLVTVAATSVWMHFKKRILSHVRLKFELDKEQYDKLSKEQKRHRNLELMQMACDICREPTEKYQSPEGRHTWVDSERKRLGIDDAVEKWQYKPLLYHLKTKPYRFLKCMELMSLEREASGGRAFSLYPLRRNLVPKHARFDQKALRDLLSLGSSDYTKQKARERNAKKRKADEMTETETIKRRSKDDMVEERATLFAQVLNLRAAGVQRRQRFDYAFTTDGVCARIQMRVLAKSSTKHTTIPSRGIWAIDELKRVSRLEEMQVVGIDPGKRELLVGVDMDNVYKKPIRYTQKERLRDIRSRQYSDEARREKPLPVQLAEEELVGYNSRSASLQTFCKYCNQRLMTLRQCLEFYGQYEHRRRRWKVAIKTQQSESKLYNRIEAMQSSRKQLVLAYGSWGLVAGRPGAACNRGNPPCIGVGLMRKLACRFVVAPTPEAYTSKTCCRCLGDCGAWEDLERIRGKKIRGLRRCTQRDCMAPLNRDRNGATNCGTNFMSLMKNRPTIRSLSDEELAFHRATLCMECG